MKRSLLPVIFFLIFGLGCQPGEKKTASTDPMLNLSSGDVGRRWQDVIAEATTGEVPLTAKIAVRFIKSVPGVAAGESVDPGIFSFTPSIKGRAYWFDARTILFEPEGYLPTNQTFQVTVEVSKLKKGLESISSFPFSISTPGNELLKIGGQFQPVRPGDPTEVKLKVVLTFVHPVELSRLEKEIALPFSWKQDGTRPVYHGVSEPLVRGDTAMTFDLVVSEKSFDLDAKKSHHFILEPVQVMVVKSWETLESEGSIGVQAIFTEPLKENVDYSAYVNVDPHVETDVTARGKYLIITGAFSRGTDYMVELRPGISNIWGGKSRDVILRTLIFEDLKPQMKFSSQGTIITSSADDSITFKTINLNHVTLTVTRVYPENYNQFFQVNDLAEQTYNFQEINRVGDVVYSKKLSISTIKNQWLQNQIDLKPIFETSGKGMYVLRLSFAMSDIDYNCEGWNRRQRNYQDYYEHPCSGGYYYQHAGISKPVIISDIGIVAVKEREKMTVYTTNLLTGEPEGDVRLKLYSYQNRVVEEVKTNSRGEATLTASGHLLSAEKRGQVSILKFSSDLLKLDEFPIEGVRAHSADGKRVFVYTDRGVYRPGDTVFLTSILREGVSRIPDGVPLKLRVVNPLQQKTLEKVNREGVEGTYTFTIPTRQTDPTGMWRADLFVGDGRQLASLPFRVEMVAPPRIKVKLESEKPVLLAGDDHLLLHLSSDYLFGAPGAGLAFKAAVSITPDTVRSKVFKAFTFTHQGRKFSPILKTVKEGVLSDEGKADVIFAVTEFDAVPSSLKATFSSEILEKSGRPVTAFLTVPLHTYPAYAGIRNPESRWVKRNTPIKTQVVAVNPSGTPMPGRTLTVNLYTNSRYWWYEYSSAASFQVRYKDDINTKLLRTFTVKSGSKPVPVSLELNEWGEYLLEVVDNEGGHTAGYFFRGTSWGDDVSPPVGGNTLEMKAGRAVYHPGEIASIKIKTPARGRLLVAVLKGDEKLYDRWYKLKAEQTEIDLPITREMTPNIYLFAEAVQPHAESVNDRPLRSYGILPLQVEEAETRLVLNVKTADVVKPGGELTVEIESADGKPAVVTAAVVDEGLLSLTGFTTPDPWSYFYQKVGLDVALYDIFDRVIGVTWGPVHQTFSVGGGLGEGRKTQLNPIGVRRFPPVALFQGPVTLDGRGRASLTFKLPNYMGEVRVMVVGSRESAYGSVERSVKVREEVVILPSLPRVLGPAEKFTLPVLLFTTEEGVGPVTIRVEANEMLRIIGPDRLEMNLAGKEEREVTFSLASKNAVGAAEVKVIASFKGKEVRQVVNLAVRPSNPVVTESLEKVLEPSKTVSLTIPELGLDGTRSARLNIWKTKPVHFNRHLNWLIRYPYGCIEQTVSSAFPQLYLKDLIAASPDKIDRKWVIQQTESNIQAAINRLIGFSRQDGAFSYWPGSRGRVNEWSNLYAGHFLIEAKTRGYYVPYILERWLDYETGIANRDGENWRTRTYRLYLLALAGRPNLSAMNLVRENYLDKLKAIDLHLLAAAFKLAGAGDIAADLAKGFSGAPLSDKSDWRKSFGSSMVDNGILLNVAVLFDDASKSLELFELLNHEFQRTAWYSTHSLAWGLTGMGKYVEKSVSRGKTMRGEVIFSDETKIGFASDNYLLTLPLDERIGEEVTIRSSVDFPLVIEVIYEGVPLKMDLSAVAKGMTLETRFLSEEGEPIDPAVLDRGTTFFAHISLQPRTGLDYLAVTQIFPSGWEIVNTRLTGEALPTWTGNYPVSPDLSYTDIRDDRVSWFLNKTYSARKYHFLVKLVAVTRGSFAFPPTYAEAMYDAGFSARVPLSPVEVK